jgi:hypothetical protein
MHHARLLLALSECIPDWCEVRRSTNVGDQDLYPCWSAGGFRILLRKNRNDNEVFETVKKTVRVSLQLFKNRFSVVSRPCDGCDSLEKQKKPQKGVVGTAGSEAEVQRNGDGERWISEVEREQMW